MYNQFAIEHLRQTQPTHNDAWAGMWYWFAWYAWNAWNAWYAWYAWDAWYAWGAWSAWNAWYAWPTNWPTQYIPTHYVISATLTGPSFGAGTYYGSAFELTHTINTGTLTVSGSLQLTREGVD